MLQYQFLHLLPKRLHGSSPMDDRGQVMDSKLTFQHPEIDALTAHETTGVTEFMLLCRKEASMCGPQLFPVPELKEKKNSLPPRLPQGQIILRKMAWETLVKVFCNILSYTQWRGRRRGVSWVYPDICLHIIITHTQTCIPRFMKPITKQNNPCRHINIIMSAAWMEKIEGTFHIIVTGGSVHLFPCLSCWSPSHKQGTNLGQRWYNNRCISNESKKANSIFSHQYHALALHGCILTLKHELPIDRSSHGGDR